MLFKLLVLLCAVVLYLAIDHVRLSRRKTIDHTEREHVETLHNHRATAIVTQRKHPAHGHRKTWGKHLGFNPVSLHPSQGRPCQPFNASDDLACHAAHTFCGGFDGCPLCECDKGMILGRDDHMNEECQATGPLKIGDHCSDISRCPSYQSNQQYCANDRCACPAGMKPKTDNQGCLLPDRLGESCVMYCGGGLSCHHISKTCIQCAPNCALCTYSGGASCDSDGCVEGFYYDDTKDANPICKTCNVQNCKSCRRTTTTPAPTTTTTTTTTQAPSANATNNSTGTGNTTACNQTCPTCAPPAPTQPPELVQCSECNDGFYLENNTCQACNRECRTCSLSASHCTSCGDGYYQTTSNSCNIVKVHGQNCEANALLGEGECDLKTLSIVCASGHCACKPGFEYVDTGVLIGKVCLPIAANLEVHEGFDCTLDRESLKLFMKSYQSHMLVLAGDAIRRVCSDGLWCVPEALCGQIGGSDPALRRCRRRVTTPITPPPTPPPTVADSSASKVVTMWTSLVLVFASQILTTLV